MKKITLGKKRGLDFPKFTMTLPEHLLNLFKRFFPYFNMSILKVKTREGYTVKVLSELLQGCLKDACFNINNKGISLIGVDTKSRNGTILVDLELDKNNFQTFKSPENKSFPIGTNLIHLHKMLKPIKKKDFLTLLIDKERPSDLGIKIGPNGENGSTISYLVITNINPVEVDIPDGYNNPIKTTAKEFQKLKTLNKLSKQIKVVSDGNVISFFAGKENLWSRQVNLGEPDEDDSEKEKKIVYSQTFETGKIIRLVKMAGLSSIIQIYTKPDLPLKFELNVGTLGKIRVYIKSEETIEAERDDEENQSGIVPVDK
jgi:proliferating cell nuclear antigen PCNA